jgi:hypothetical protein
VLPCVSGAARLVGLRCVGLLRIGSASPVFSWAVAETGAARLVYGKPGLPSFPLVTPPEGQEQGFFCLLFLGKQKE